MKLKAASFRAWIVLFFLVCLLAVPQYSHAGTPIGTICFQDDFGDSWLVDIGSTGFNFDIHGFRVGSIPCNGTFVQSVSGTATIDGSFLAFGVWSMATSLDCQSVVWQGVVDISTFQGSGSFITVPLGDEGTFNLFEISCDAVIQAAKNGSGSLKDPSQR